MRFDPLPSTYGGDVQVYESSAASGPHIWVRVRCPENLNEPNGRMVDAVAHMTSEDARTLGEQLLHLTDNHYQELDRD